MFNLKPQLLGQVRVIAEARLHHDRTRRRIHHKPLVSVVRFQLGVEGDPDFSPGLRIVGITVRQDFLLTF